MYPNQNEEINVTDPGNTEDGTITRVSEEGLVCVEDQSFSNVRQDTLLANLQCAATGDVLTNVQLIQVTVDSNLYCGNIAKNESSISTKKQFR